MCTATNKQKVEEVVYEFVKIGRMFTAKTATDEAKQRGATERHNHMKGSVHDMWNYMQDCGYKRTLVEVAPGMKAWLYYPDGLDPDDFVTGTQTPNAVPAAPVVQVSSKVKVVTPDKDGRICVNGSILKKANILPGDTVQIDVKNDEAVISWVTKNADVELSVHADGRIRINPTTLKPMGDVKRFRVEIEAKSIHLKPL